MYTYTNFITITFSNQGLLAKEAACKLLHTLAFRAGGMGVATINKSGVIVFRMRVLVIAVLCNSMKHDIAMSYACVGHSTAPGYGTTARLAPASERNHQGLWVVT